MDSDSANAPQLPAQDEHVAPLDAPPPESPAVQQPAEMADNDQGVESDSDFYGSNIDAEKSSYHTTLPNAGHAALASESSPVPEISSAPIPGLSLTSDGPAADEEEMAVQVQDDVDTDQVQSETHSPSPDESSAAGIPRQDASAEQQIEAYIAQASEETNTLEPGQQTPQRQPSEQQDEEKAADMVGVESTASMDMEVDDESSDEGEIKESPPLKEESLEPGQEIEMPDQKSDDVGKQEVKEEGDSPAWMTNLLAAVDTQRNQGAGKPAPDPGFLVAAEENKGNENAEWQYDSSDADSNPDSSEVDGDEPEGGDVEDVDGDVEMSSEEIAKILMAADADHDSEGAARTKNEVEEEPVNKPDVTLTPDTKIEPLGVIENILDKAIVIKASVSGEHRVLNEGSVVCTEDKKLVGGVHETFGRVEQPLYQVRFSSNEEITELGLQFGSNLFYAPEYSEYVFTVALQGAKGTDASNFDDEEVGQQELEFSDDEEEAAHKKKMRQIRQDARANTNFSPPTGPAAQQTRQQSPQQGSGKKKNRKRNRNRNKIKAPDGPQQPLHPTMLAPDEPYVPLQRPANLHEMVNAPPPPLPSAQWDGRGGRGGRGDRGHRGRGGHGQDHGHGNRGGGGRSGRGGGGGGGGGGGDHGRGGRENRNRGGRTGRSDFGGSQNGQKRSRSRSPHSSEHGGPSKRFQPGRNSGIPTGPRAQQGGGHHHSYSPPSPPPAVQVPQFGGFSMPTPPPPPPPVTTQPQSQHQAPQWQQQPAPPQPQYQGYSQMAPIPQLQLAGFQNPLQLLQAFQQLQAQQQQQQVQAQPQQQWQPPPPQQAPQPQWQQPAPQPAWQPPQNGYQNLGQPQQLGGAANANLASVLETLKGLSQQQQGQPPK